jgi:hypothetical protein
MVYEVTGFTQIGHSISVATNCMGSLPLHWATLSEEDHTWCTKLLALLKVAIRFLSQPTVWAVCRCTGPLSLKLLKRTSLTRIMHAGFGFPRSYRAFAEHVRGTCAARPPLRLGKYTIWFITMPARGWAFLCTYRQ